MRNANPTPQLQGPPNYPGPGGRSNLNPPFDPRILSTGGANPAMKDRPIKRGRIVALEGGLQVNFMFNPSTLDVSYAYDPSLADPTKTDTSVTASTIGEGQISVNLLFDRTYEVWNRGFSIASTFGVHADILAFYAFLGMIDASYSASSGWENLYPKNQIARKDSYLYVGDTLKYYGYVTSLAVSYTHWSFDMIPVRAALGISFNVIMTPPGSTSTSSTSSSSSSTTSGSITNPTKLPDQKGDPTLGGLVP
jgi:hypothetical protein